jgi:hypothetical protein
MLGSVLVRLGRYEEALKIAKSMERSARSQAEKDMVQSLIESLNQAQEKKDPGSSANRITAPR